MDDGRPMDTDTFLCLAVDIEDDEDLRYAIQCWIEGAWDEALYLTAASEMEGMKDE